MRFLPSRQMSISSLLFLFVAGGASMKLFKVASIRSCSSYVKLLMPVLGKTVDSSSQVEMEKAMKEAAYFEISEAKISISWGLHPTEY